MKVEMDRRVFRIIVLAAILPLVAGAWLTATETEPGSSGVIPESQPKPVESRLWSAEELDSLVAPVALYPDPLLAQVLAASTYPLEVVEAQQWLKRHSALQGKALVEAAAKEDWDPSVQALVTFPGVLGRLTENVRWTTDLGNAFLAQPQDVMDAVQRMRLEAKDAGRLKTTREQEVNTKVVEERTIIEIVPASPEVIYVPVYNPEIVWGAPAYYPYPALWYDPWPSAADYWIRFGTGVFMSLFYSGWNDWYYWGGPWGWNWGWNWGWPGWGCNWGWNWGWHGWGWGCGWGPRGGVYFNGHFCHHYGYGHHENHYGHDGHNGHDGRPGYSSYGNWRHDGYHRGGVDYRNNDVARRYGANNGRTANPRSSARGSYGSGSRAGLTREQPGRSAVRGADTYRSTDTYRSAASRQSAGRDRGTVVQGARGETIYTNRPSGRTASTNPSLSRDRSSATRGSDSAADRPSSRSTYTRSSSSGGRTADTGVRTIGRSSSENRDSSGGRIKTVGRSYDRTRATSGGATSYASRPSYGSTSAAASRPSYANRSYSSSGSSGNRSFSSSRSYGNRSYSSGGASGSRSVSSGRSSSGRSYSSGGSSGGSYRGGSSGRSSGGSSSGSRGGSRGGSSGGGHRR